MVFPEKDESMACWAMAMIQFVEHNLCATIQLEEKSCLVGIKKIVGFLASRDSYLQEMALENNVHYHG